MYNNSYGDSIVNIDSYKNNTNTMLASKDRALKNIEKYRKKNVINTDEIVKNDNINNIIPIQKNEDGSLKYTFDNIYDNKQLAAVAKSYYTNRDGEGFEDGVDGDIKAINKFISDRTWNQANTYNMAKEYFYVKGLDITEDQKARLSYLTRYWSELPNFYEEGGRGAKGFFQNLGIGIIDPLNFLGIGVGGIVTKGVLKKAGGEVIKNEVKKGVKKKVLKKGVLDSPEKLQEISKKVRREALLKSASSVAAIDGVGLGTIDIANQTVEKEIDLRQTYDPIRTGTVALTGAGIGLFVGGGGSYVVSKAKDLLLKKNNTLPTKKLRDASKKDPDNSNQSEGVNSPIGVIKKVIGNKLSAVRTNLADQWDFIKVLQKEIDPESATDVIDLKKLYKSKNFKVDPILEPYFQLRLLTASSTRAHGFVMDGVYLPPDQLAKAASYIKGKSEGLHTTLKPFDDKNEVNQFLNYIAAKRQNFIGKRRPKLDKTLPTEKSLRQQYIDYVELDSSAFKKKYGFDSNRKISRTSYNAAFKKYKQFTDELLEYQVQSGLLARKDANKILRENPFFIPLTRDKTATSGVISTVKEQTRKLLGLSRPGAVKIAQQKQEGDINLYQNLITYTYQTVLASDRNRAKIAFYNMLDKGDKLGKIDKNAIARKVGKNEFAEITNVAVKNVKRAYSKAGAKFDPEKDVVTKVGAKRKDQLSNLDSLDVLTFSNTFKPTEGSKEIADIVYRNGKAEIYEIMDSNLAEVFKGIGEAKTYKVLAMFGENGWASKYARFASQAITYSPPFVAFNIIRDTLAGTINSAFGIGSRSLDRATLAKQKLKGTSGLKILDKKIIPPFDPEKSTGARKAVETALQKQNIPFVGYIPGFTSVKGYISAFRQTQMYKEGLLNGMGYSSRSETEALTPRTLKKMVEKGASLGVASNVTKFYTNQLGRFIGKPIGYGWRQYKKLVQSAEYATRMGEYQLAKAAGFSDIGAAFAGREVATDFGMRGSNVLLNALSRNTMFLNASIQGLYRTGRVFFEQPGKAAALVSTTIVAPEIALYHINSQHPEYAKIDSRIKQLNYLFPNYVINKQGKKVLDSEVPFNAMPKPYDLGIFANIAVGILDGLYKGSDGVTKKYVAESFSQIMPGVPLPTVVRPFIEMMFNTNLYSGSPILGLYERQRLDQLQLRPSTRKIAIQLSHYTANTRSFLERKKEGTVKNPIFTPIEMDYIIGSYFTGLLQYPFDILEQGDFSETPNIKGGGIMRTVQKFATGRVKGVDDTVERPAKREDEADFSSFKNALSIITRRFKVAAPIKNSQYHKEWSSLINKAKKLKQIDYSQMDLKKSHETRLIGIFGNIKEADAKGEPIITPEVQAFGSVSDILKTVESKLRVSREQRNMIATSSLDPDIKKAQIDFLILAENETLKLTIETLALMEIEYLFDDAYNHLGKIEGFLFNSIFGPGEESVKPNPLEK